MPTYQYACSSCEKVWDELHKIADRHTPLEKPCPHCSTSGTVVQQITAVSFGDPMRMGLIKAPDGFKDVLKNIHKRTPGSNLVNSSRLANL